MREIKFRGKDNHGVWRYGCYVAFDGLQGAIYYPIRNSKTNDVLRVEWCYVDEKTVGQFTGLHDKNGNEIYEGDIVESFDHYGKIGNLSVVWDNDDARFLFADDEDFCYLVNNILLYESKVIGNVFDNLDLLKSNIPDGK